MDCCKPDSNVNIDTMNKLYLLVYIFRNESFRNSDNDQNDNEGTNVVDAYLVFVSLCKLSVKPYQADR